MTPSDSRDLVERLRNVVMDCANGRPVNGGDLEDVAEAADEIERLRNLLKDARKTLAADGSIVAAPHVTGQRLRRYIDGIHRLHRQIDGVLGEPDFFGPTDDEIIAEVRANGEDPDALAAEVAGSIRDAIEAHDNHADPHTSQQAGEGG